MFIWLVASAGFCEFRMTDEPHQGGVAVGVVAGRELGRWPRAARRPGRGPAPGPPGPARAGARRPASRACICCVEAARPRQVASAAVASRVCAAVRAARARVEPPGRGRQRLAGLVQVALGVAHLAAAPGAASSRRSSAAASGSAVTSPGARPRRRRPSGPGRRIRVEVRRVRGKERTSGAVQFGEVNGLTVTDGVQTLRYLRVITSVGISVSRTPRAAIPPIARYGVAPVDPLHDVGAGPQPAVDHEVHERQERAAPPGRPRSARPPASPSGTAARCRGWRRRPAA